MHLRHGEGVRFEAEENAQIVEAKLCVLLGKRPSDLDAEDSDRLYSVLTLAETEAAMQREKFLEAIARMFGA